MNGKVIGLILVVVVFIGVGVWWLMDVRTSPAVLPTCNVLQEGSPGGPRLVFFGTKEQTERYMSALYQVAPFGDARDRFTVSYIDSVVPSCELYQGVALFCYSRALVEQAAACPHEYVIVLKANASSIRSSAFKSVLSINTAHQLSVFVHEFGHAFGDFAEEYTPASLPASSDNCQASCDDFGVKDGCYQGCSATSYYRSIDSGIMRTLYATQYGTWHEQYLRSLLGVVSSSAPAPSSDPLLSPVECASQTYALVHLVRTNGLLQVQDVSTAQGCALPTDRVETGDLRVFTDVQELGAEQLSGETFTYEGDLFVPVSVDVSQLTITLYGQPIGEVHLGATLCRA